MRGRGTLHAEGTTPPEAEVGRAWPPSELTEVVSGAVLDLDGAPEPCPG